MKKRLLSIALALSLVAPACATPTAEAHRSANVNQQNVVSMGRMHSALITTDGSLWAWGSNSWGILGIGASKDRCNTPTKVMSNVSSVSAGSDHTLIIKKDASLWAWGLNRVGEVGDGTKVTREKPAKIMDSVVAAVASDQYSAAIKQDGSLWLWGYNNKGQLGDGTTTDRVKPVKIMSEVVAVSLGCNHTMALKKDGSLWTWGWNAFGQLGNGTTSDSSSPIKIMDGVVAIAAGGYHSAAIKQDGSLWTWGSNSQGQLGNGTAETSVCPTKIMEGVSMAVLGDDHSAAVKADGSLWMFGQNKYGELGNGTRTNSAKPVKVLDNVAMVSLGFMDSAAVKKDGSVWVWGSNSLGKLGLGLKDSYDSHVAVPTLLSGYIVSAPKIPQVPQMPQKCTITLNLNGGDGTTKITCDKNGTITPPNNPSRDGYFFAGWYKDKTCKKPWNFDTDKVTGNCTLYAKWEPKSTTTVTAEPSTQKVEIDGKKIVLNSYVLRNDQGYPVNFVKLRDIAYLLDGTQANFNVDWRNNAIRLDARKPYTTPNGAEMTVPTVAAAPAKTSLTPVLTGGVTAPLEAFLLTDKNGGGHNYFKLRDIGKVAGFNVEWDGGRGVIVVTTTEDYIG